MMGETDKIPASSFLFPSLVCTSTIADVRLPYCALKPAVYTSTLRMASVSKTEKSPME